jgi:hypothetical protein
MSTRSRCAVAAPLAAAFVALPSGGCADEESASPSAQTSAAATAPAPPPPTGTTASTGAGATGGETQAPNALRFRGNGDRRLPAFRVRRPGTTLQWTNLDEVFSLFTAERTLVDSVALRGERFLRPGVYRIDVIASGGWEIVVPRARRVR